ncbi:hypothetical protein GLAREA_09846 [Glarea lozoyensis ATCC 20868]|uniref:Uncharacterized protein n=1 Tax=Glarea lozoyensis (strain ATCC 20868 / MF5171) TaxID=1116229 RepID=S3CST6_GLAL2|nr:uncharacterized protein GLAREA_09846 [Glarea lozoyensis ATCC 20868]EPE28725.1 hypothetical protein GLAREA_09846 [Glarea lozoyensis ATCC 20868]
MASSSPPNIASSPRLYSSTGSPVLRVRRTTTPTITSSPPSTPPAARNKRIKNVAQETKEWVIDYATEHGLGNTLTADRKSGALSNVAMFNSDHEDFHKDYTTTKGQDLPTALKVANLDNQHARYAHAKARWIHAPERVELKAEVERLMDEELKLGDGEGEGEGLSFQAKACLISGRRSRKRLYSGMDSQPSSTSTVDKRFGYQVQLQRLVDGFAGNTHVTTLYFLYTTSFYEFRNALRDATQLCKIPPDPVVEARVISFRNPIPNEESENNTESQRETSTTSTSSQLTNTTPSETERNSTITPTSSTPIETPSQIPAKPREQNGYLLSDGDWIYKRQKLHFTDGKQMCITEDSRGKIGCEEDYWKMVRLLKMANNAKKVVVGEDRSSEKSGLGRGRGEGKVDILDKKFDWRFTHGLWIMHQLDYDQHQRWKEKKQREKAEDEALRKRHLEEHGVELGQYWGEWRDEVAGRE